tara:strand:- start:199 stop:1524 length:1326 start_codon:yes stop_codon:yes gene_type:complete
MNRIDNSGTGIAGLGRGGDSKLAHVMTGEMVVPPVISPETQAIIRKEMIAAGIDPNEYTVGEGMSINPITGLPEFGLKKFLSKAAKAVKKVVKVVAPVAAVIPGPWQAPAILYNKGKAVVNIAKGDGGLGDLMTVMAGGSQKVFGADGALKSVTSGDFLKAGGGFGDAFKAIGSVDGKFAPLQYGSNIGKTYMDDQKSGYFGLFGGGEQPEMYVDQFGNPVSAAEYANMNPADQVLYSQVAPSNNNFLSNARNFVTGGGNDGQSRIGLIEDMLKGRSSDPVREGGGILSGGGGLGGNAGLMAMAALYGKAVKDDYKRKEGGLKDIRQSVRPDLMPAPTFTGFDLGVRKNAALGGLQELDMRNGGPSVGPGTGTSDDIPAMLSDGEFVMTSAANNGLGGFKITKTETGIELQPNGQPSRQKGAKNMDTLMKTFEQFNKVGMA